MTFSDEVRKTMRAQRAKRPTIRNVGGPPAPGAEEPTDLGSGARPGPPAGTTPSMAMSGWMRSQARRLATRSVTRS
jgi:hypothetical protein